MGGPSTRIAIRLGNDSQNDGCGDAEAWQEERQSKCEKCIHAHVRARNRYGKREVLCERVWARNSLDCRKRQRRSRRKTCDGRRCRSEAELYEPAAKGKR